MDVYEVINQRIIGALENGTVPWQCPWKKGEYGMPRNFASTKPYRGINTFMLSMTSIALGYQSPFWVSFKQAKDLGGHVKAGEKSPAFSVFYKPMKKETVDENGDTESESYSVLRYTPVWNTDQCDGLKVPDLSPADSFKHEIIPQAQAIVDAMPNRPAVNIRASNRAFYSPSQDAVTVPEMSQFSQAEMFYSTMFHELGHSTGHSSRLAREFGSSFGDHTYSKEELVAEFTASYLCGIAGIENRTIENSASYLNSWLTVLKDKANKKWITWAAGQAQKAADCIRGIQQAEFKKAA